MKSPESLTNMGKIGHRPQRDKQPYTCYASGIRSPNKPGGREIQQVCCLFTVILPTCLQEEQEEQE